MAEPTVCNSHLAEITGAPEVRKLGQPDTLAEYVSTLVCRNPAGVFTEIGFDGTERSRTYGELFEGARKLSASVRSLVLKDEEVAVLCFETVIDYVPAAWACLLNGYSFLPLSISNVSRGKDEFSERTRRIMERLRAPLILTEPRLEKLFSDVFGDAIILDTKRLLASPPHSAGSVGSVKPGDILIETSGTTGGPKIARLGGDKIVNRLFDGIDPDQRVSLNLLVHTSVGGLRLLLPIGRQTIYLNPARMMANASIWLDCVSRFGVTDAGMSSAMAAKVNEIVDERAGAWNTSSLERLAFGSETVTPSIIRRLVSNLELYGMRDASASLVYSMTETGPLFSSRVPVRDLLDDGLECDGRFKLTRCTDSWNVRIVRETGEVACLGEIGQIEVRSKTRLFRGYHPSGDGPRPDGWFYTGDLGCLDDQGLLLTGREKSTISINARKISSEDVERCLTELDGIKPGLVFAAPFRSDDSVTDELAVFFTPAAVDDAHLAALIPNIHSAVSKALGVGISHLVAIPEDQIGRTTTGKVKRTDLVEGLRLGRWNPLKREAVGRNDHTENLAWLSGQWRKILKLEFDPRPDGDFFDLGGDSLASAELLFAVEDKYHCRLSLDAFFESPTLAKMADLIHEALATSTNLPRCNGSAYTDDVLHKVQSFSGSWRGERQFSDSLLIGFNTEGQRQPIFWVFQEYAEAWQLAQSLGSDQPLYAMRSCVGIVKGHDYTTEILETICNRYLWEMLALPLSTEFVIGGNCQGGIVALALARRLKKIGRPPLKLVLLEWNFSHGRYSEPTLLIYGEESFTSEMYRRPEASKINWQHDFPRYVVASVPADHGFELKRDESVTCLVGILRKQTAPDLSRKPGRHEHRKLALKLARRQAEAKELRAELVQRETEARTLRAAHARELMNLKASTSWRVTAPLRAIGSRLRALLTRKSD